MLMFLLHCCLLLRPVALGRREYCGTMWMTVRYICQTVKTNYSNSNSSLLPVVCCCFFFFLEQVIELDKVEHGSAIQDALLSITGQRSVPNVFIGGSVSETWMMDGVISAHLLQLCAFGQTVLSPYSTLDQSRQGSRGAVFSLHSTQTFCNILHP